MKARAIQKNIHLSPRKARLVCDLVRNKKVTEALSILEFTNKKAALIVNKLLNQAIANATNNHAMVADKLYVYSIVANQGPILKRTSPRAKGSADLIRKRHCHIEIILSDDVDERKKDLEVIKEKLAKRAKNNKGYSAKQRNGIVEKKPKQKTVKPKKAVEKKVEPVVKQEPVKVVDAETLKREQQALKVVKNPPKEKNKNPGEPLPPVETTKIIMISTKPKYANIILDNKEKNVFFYKVTPVNKIERVLIYATEPVKGVVGEFDLDKIHIVAPSTAWQQHGSASCLNKKEFDKYFEGHEKAHALIAKKTYRYSKPKKLEEFDISKGPSGFQYLK
ncbi:MAG: 50S ribosomal protein L22 [Mycoplasma sp.]|nr:50S ribosomal protein L22 [Mycoplasma sp.]